MFERFTDRARRVVVLAQDEGRALNHNYIGTEHILLGLIQEGEGLLLRHWSPWVFLSTPCAPKSRKLLAQAVIHRVGTSLYPARQEGA